MTNNIPKSRISQALQLVSLFAVITALLGFITVNIYLSLFGFWDFNFLKVQYFSAGTLFLYYLLMPSGLLYISLKIEEVLGGYREYHQNSKYKCFFTFILIKAIFIALFATSVYGFLFPFLFSNFSITTSFVVSLGILWTGIVWVGVLILVKSYIEIKQSPEMMIYFKDILTYIVAHYRLLYVFLVSPFLVSIFSLIVYPIVPHYLGGGKPVEVNISFNQGYDSNQVSISNPFEAFLVYQSTDSLLVLNGTGIYQLKQSDIAYIKYIEANDWLKQFENTINVNLATNTSL